MQTKAIYELEADRLIAEGGINTKSVSYITKTANRIKDQMDERLQNLIINETMVEPIFFIQNRALYKLWKRVFRHNYQTNIDMFKQAFAFESGKDVITWQRVKKLHNLICC